MRHAYSYLLLIVFFVCSSYGPPNCNLYEGDDACLQACKEAEAAISFPQGSRQSQMHFDASISLCPTFDYSYYEKAVPYAKRGKIGEWKVMLDQALAINPAEYLGTRAWYHFFFMRNYQPALDDLARLDSLVRYDIGFTGDGEHHLNLMRALCHKGLGQSIQAIACIEQLVGEEGYYPGLYDYLHLGVLYLEQGDLHKAETALQKQIEINELAEVHFYLGQVKKQQGEEEASYSHFQTALSLYDKEQRLSNPYIVYPDKVYRIQIEEALNEE